MRTYKRKRPEYQAIEGVEALCRLCLCSEEVTVPIFGEDADQLCALSMRIMICVGLEMTRDNNLPNAICLGCYKELERYYTFRKKCEVTYQKLKAHVLAIKERDSNMTLMKPTKVEDENENEKLVDCEEDQQQLVLTFDENQQIELVNFVNSSRDPLQDNEAFLTTTSLEELSNEIVQSQDEENHTQNESTQNNTTSLEHIPSSNLDVTLLSTLLLELGVLRQVQNRIVLADDELNMVELEGVDNTKIVLQLVEEDEEENVEAEIEKQSTKDNSNRIKSKKSNDLTCPECNKWFSSRGALTRHARVHSGARPYACGACGRRFAQRAVLTRHEHVHKEKRPFPCAQCPKSFTQRGSLESHARRHAPPHARPLSLYACSACDKVFLYASGLSRHMAVHSGRRYACARCSRAFADRSALARHHKRHPPTPDPLRLDDE